MPKNIVWTALVSALAIGATLVSAVIGSSNFVMAFGATAIASAILSQRE